jgi:hypothetical protein
VYIERVRGVGFVVVTVGGGFAWQHEFGSRATTQDNKN